MKQQVAVFLTFTRMYSMDATNFLKVLYETIVPRRPQEPAKPQSAPVHEQSWESYRHHAGASLPPTSGINRQFFQHNLLAPASSSAGKYMTNQFNTYCSQAGVQCTVQMDPSDFQQIFIFKNLGDRLVKIEWVTRPRVGLYASNHRTEWWLIRNSLSLILVPLSRGFRKEAANMAQVPCQHSAIE